MVIVPDDQNFNDKTYQLKLVGETSFVGQLNQNLTAFFQKNHSVYPECIQNFENGNQNIITESCDQFARKISQSNSKTMISRHFQNEVMNPNSRTSAGVDGVFEFKSRFVNKI